MGEGYIYGMIRAVVLLVCSEGKASWIFSSRVVAYPSDQVSDPTCDMKGGSTANYFRQTRYLVLGVSYMLSR